MYFSNGQEVNKTYLIQDDFNSEEWPKSKLQTVWIWNPGKFPSFCAGVLKMYNFG